MSGVVVTGAAGGIGAELVRQLSEQGERVWALDREWPGEPAASGPGDPVRRLTADVTDPRSVTEALEAIRAEDVPVTGLVNTAGIVLAQPLLQTTPEEWERVFAVNARGVFLMTQAVLGLMIEQSPEDPRRRRGIVTVSSNAGRVPRAEFGAYGASKAAATSVTHSFGLQAAAHGIRCNVVSPGTTRTPMITETWAGEDRTAQTVAGAPESFRLGIPLGRIAEPEDIVAAVMFLLSERARHVTLQDLTVDGGATF